MKRIIIAVILTIPILGFVLSGHSYGVGTPAGTPINNTANINYDVLGMPFAISDSATFNVDEIIDFTLTWQDASNVQTTSGGLGSVLTFAVTNTGNGTDSYALAVNNALVGDDFDPIFSGIFLDTNGNSVYDLGPDLAYAGTTGDIAADASLTIFVLNDMPGALADGLLGDSTLTATSNTGVGAVGTVFLGGGDAGTSAVLAIAGGTQNDTGTYKIATLAVTVVKSAVVTDLIGGTDPSPGATITYTLTVTTLGSGTAEGVVVTDLIPANTTYTANTLTLDTGGGPVLLTDASDIDAGDVGVTTPGTVTVDIGDITNATPPQIITFEVTID